MPNLNSNPYRHLEHGYLHFYRNSLPFVPHGNRNKHQDTQSHRNADRNSHGRLPVGFGLSLSPTVGSGPNELHGVRAFSPSDAWVVGHSYSGTGYPITLTEHWNGQNWSVVPSPNVGTGYNYLTAVAGASPGDIWATGYYLAAGGWRGQVLHWDGTSWSQAGIPNTSPYDSELFSVSARSASDVWAVGREDKQ